MKHEAILYYIITLIHQWSDQCKPDYGTRTDLLWSIQPSVPQQHLCTGHSHSLWLQVTLLLVGLAFSIWTQHSEQTH